MKILEPLIGLIAGFSCIIFCISPANFASLPNWNEINRGALSGIVLLGVLQIAFGSLSPEWKVIRPVGWVTLASAFVLRPIFESSDYAMPIALSIFEAAGCIAFATRLLINPTGPDSHDETGIAKTQVPAEVCPEMLPAQ